MNSEIIEEYKSGNGLSYICGKHNIGKKRLKQILIENGIKIRPKGKQKNDKKYKINDYRIPKFRQISGFYYTAIHKKTGWTSNDYLNKSGCLSRYIKMHDNIDSPSIHFRNEIYKLTGNYWYEDFFYIVINKEKNYKICPICGWKTTDIENKSGAFSVHFKKAHNLTIKEYLKKYPGDLPFFHYCDETKQLQFDTNEENFVTCKICGKKLRRIDHSHLRKHGITEEEYKKKFGMKSTLCHTTAKKLSDDMNKLNVSMPQKVIKSSKDERNLFEFIQNLGIKNIKKNDRTVLQGKELDIYLPEEKLAIEYNGCLWHSNKFGKEKNYHLEKTINCNKKGIELIHIFEDELNYNKDETLSKIKRKLITEKNELTNSAVKRISKKEFALYYPNKDFLETGAKYYAVYNNKKMVSEIALKKKDSNSCNLYNFFVANDIMNETECFKMLLDFIAKNENYNEFYSELDLRFYNGNNNNYLLKYGFVKIKDNPPRKWLLNSKLNRCKRFEDSLKNKKLFKEELKNDKVYEIYDCGVSTYKLKI